VKAKKTWQKEDDPIVVLVAAPMLGIVRVSARTQEELREKIAELRTALEW
jgi:hypothetical protein